MLDEKEHQYITWVDDYCFDCKVACKSTDKEHEDHNRLSKKKEADKGNG